MSSSKDCSVYQKESQIQKLKVEKNITYTEARRQLSVSNNSSTTTYADVTRGPPQTATVEVQTVYTWPLDKDLPTPKDFPSNSSQKTIIPSKYKTNSNSSQTIIPNSTSEIAPEVSFVKADNSKSFKGF